MSLGDGQPLHGGELVGARCVCDLEGADGIVGRNHLELRRRDKQLSYIDPETNLFFPTMKMYPSQSELLCHVKFIEARKNLKAHKNDSIMVNF